MTNYLNQEIEAFVFRLKDERISVNAGTLEAWIYECPNLESVIGVEKYLRLISIDYSSKYAQIEAIKILNNLISDAEFLTWQVKNTLDAIIDKTPKIGLELGREIYRAYELYCTGFEFLSVLALDYCIFVGYPAGKLLHVSQSAVWNDLSVDEKNALLNSLYPSIVEHAERAMNCLSKKSIVIKGYSDNDHISYQYDYEDFRPPELKTKMGFQR